MNLEKIIKIYSDSEANEENINLFTEHVSSLDSNDIWMLMNTPIKKEFRDIADKVFRKKSNCEEKKNRKNRIITRMIKYLKGKRLGAE